MKQITNKEYEEWQKYKVEKATKEDSMNGGNDYERRKVPYLSK